MVERVGRYQRITALIGIVVLLGVLVSVVALEVQKVRSEQVFFGNVAQMDQIAQYSTNEEELNAVLKGSIYETGGNMTVFGACVDGDGELVPEAVVGFTAWYPNGSIFVENQSMLPILNNSGNLSGRWRIHLTMPDTIGTYLTQMRCDYKNEYALAFSEWQNPEWVDMLVETYWNVLGLNSSVSQLSSDMGGNFSVVFSMLANISANGTGGGGGIDEGVWRKLLEIYNLKYDVWIVDEENPYFIPAGGDIVWSSVDVVAPDRVYVAARTGEIGLWDGVSWSTRNVSNVTWLGVSGYEAALEYVWAAGHVGPYFGNVSVGTAIYSVNGAVMNITDAWYMADPAAYFSDVALFHYPNDPSLSVALLLFNDGRIAESYDFGNTWYDMNLSAAGDGPGRFSMMANTDWIVGYRVAAVTRAGGFYFYNGTWALTDYPNVTFIDVALVHSGDGYVVGQNGTNLTTVWEVVNGSLGSVVFQTSGDVTPVGIDASANEDVWVATQDPSVFYHYDGFSWDYQSFRTSDNGSVIIGFVPLNVTGLFDIDVEGRSGYAVGSDGLIMKLLSSIGGGGGGVVANYTVLLENLTVQLQEINGNVAALNQTVVVNFDAVLGNLSLMQVMLSDIWGKVMGIEATVNETLVIVNATQQNVSQLVEYAERPKAWTTV